MFNKILKQGILAASLLISNLASADYCFPSDLSISSASTTSGYCSRLSVDPLFGYATLKQSDCKQNAWLWGVRGLYEFRPDCSVYLAVEAEYKSGDLKGDCTSDNEVLNGSLKSQYSDLWIEGRAGWNIINLGNFAFTPYFVGGWERENNDYVSTSPLNLTNRLSYGYIGAGGITEFIITQNLKLGLNFKLKWMVNGTHKTGGEPEIKDKSISCAYCFHYEIDLPITFIYCPNIEIGIIPFYEYKNYDKHNFDWNGKSKANFHMYGSLIQLSYLF